MVKLEVIVYSCAIVSFLFSSVLGLIEIVVDERIEKCTKPGDEVFLDISNLELIAETDTTVFANGTIRFMKNVGAPWYTHSFSERFQRGQWNLFAFDKKISDFCAVMHRPTELWYKYFKNLKGCPLNVGVSVVYIIK